MKRYHEIDDSVKIDFTVPKELQELFDMAEDADKADDFGTYLSLADTIDTYSKNCYAAGVISEGQWNMITRRYKQW